MGPYKIADIDIHDLRRCAAVQNSLGRWLETFLRWDPRDADDPTRYKRGQGPRTLWCIAIALLLGLAAPAACAYKDRVLTLDQLKTTLCTGDRAKNKALDPARKRLKAECPSGAADEDLTPDIPCLLCKHLGELSESLALSTRDVNTAVLPADELKRVVIVAFFPGMTTAAWPLAFVVLALALLWFAPPADTKRWREGQTLTLFFSIWLSCASLLTLSNLMREMSGTFQSGRRFYSHTNCDIAPWSATSYIVSFVVLSALIAMIWTRWLTAKRQDDVSYSKGSATPAQTPDPAVSAALDPKWTAELTRAFDDWQHVSVLIVAAFMPGTFLYWQAVHRYDDTRYVFAAGVYHILFATTWYIVSRPLLQHWTAWHNTRSAAIAALAKTLVGAVERNRQAELEKAAKDRLDALVSALKEIQPVPIRSAIAAVIVSTAAVLAPLYQLTSAAESTPAAAQSAANSVCPSLRDTPSPDLHGM